MYTTKLTLAFGLLTSAATSVSALGCYSRGPTFGELTGGSVSGAVEYFCKNRAAAAGEIPSGAGIRDCYPFDGPRRIEIELRNEGGSQGLSESACADALMTEVGGCDNGSEQKHGDFWYRIDPNDGPC